MDTIHELQEMAAESSRGTFVSCLEKGKNRGGPGGTANPTLALDPPFCRQLQEGGPVVSIMPPDPHSKPAAPTSLRSVVEAMSSSPDSFTMNVGWMVDYVATQHEPPVTCHDCRDEDRDRSFPCLSYENALSVAFAWLFRVIEERG